MGGGAEILDDDVRFRIARLKCRTEDWVSVHRTAHQLGMRTTATMMFGVGETFDQRVNHFDVVRRLQEQTQSKSALLCYLRVSCERLPGKVELRSR